MNFLANICRRRRQFLSVLDLGNELCHLCPVLLVDRHRSLRRHILFLLRLVNELALIAICATTGRSLVPLLAIFGLIIFVLWLRYYHKLMQAVRKGALITELALAGLHELAAQLRSIVDAEVLDIFEHGLSRWKIHDLLITLLGWQAETLLHLQLSEQFLGVR